MLFLVILVIALGWAGMFWSWSRDRYVSHSGLGLPPNPFTPRPASALAPPRTPRMARRRRREVLGALALLALLTFLLARAWSLVWTIHVLTDVAFVAYGWAVLALERPESVGLTSAGSQRPRAGVQPRFQPVLDEFQARVEPGPRVENPA